jgi:hypothetical protein
MRLYCTYFSKVIAPGAKGIIGVKYATDSWSVHVTVTSNADGQATKILTIKVSY